MERLEDYIKANFATKTAFAKHNEVTPPQVSLWIKLGYVVINDQIFKPMRELNPNN
tara:strand:+ start:2147 stop:2314 length:168 start_codon:yes stop_codon:yes gene_type:complete